MNNLPNEPWCFLPGFAHFLGSFLFFLTTNDKFDTVEIKSYSVKLIFYTVKFLFDSVKLEQTSKGMMNSLLELVAFLQGSDRNAGREPTGVRNLPVFALICIHLMPGIEFPAL